MALAPCRCSAVAGCGCPPAGAPAAAAVVCSDGVSCCAPCCVSCCWGTGFSAAAGQGALAERLPPSCCFVRWWAVLPREPWRGCRLSCAVLAAPRPCLCCLFAAAFSPTGCSWVGSCAAPLRRGRGLLQLWWGSHLGWLLGGDGDAHHPGPGGVVAALAGGCVCCWHCCGCGSGCPPGWCEGVCCMVCW